MEKKLDLFLESLCMSGGTNTEKFIKGHSEYAESILKAYGFIEIIGEGVYKEIKVTDKGAEYYRKGGFKRDRERFSNAEYDRALDNKGKKNWNDYSCSNAFSFNHFTYCNSLVWIGERLMC